MSHNPTQIRRFSLALVFVLFGVVVQPAPAHAQAPATAPLPPEIDGFTITPFLTRSFGGDLQSSPAMVGLAVGYGANERISLEGEFALAPNARQGQLIEVDTSFWSLSGNILYHFFRENFTPYAALGIGVVSSNPDDIALLNFDGVERNATGFAWNFGGGLKAALNNRFGVRGDLRYVNASNAAPDHWRLYGGLVIRRIGE